MLDGDSSYCREKIMSHCHGCRCFIVKDPDTRSILGHRIGTRLRWRTKSPLPLLLFRVVLEGDIRKCSLLCGETYRSRKRREEALSIRVT